MHIDGVEAPGEKLLLGKEQFEIGAGNRTGGADHPGAGAQITQQMDQPPQPLLIEAIGRDINNAGGFNIHIKDILVAKFDFVQVVHGCHFLGMFDKGRN